MAEKKVTKKTAPKAEKKASKKSDIFAIFEAGGKQHVVSVGDIVDVELMGDFKKGDTVEFDKVLMLDTGTEAKIGTPYVSGAKVKATFEETRKGKKLTIVRYKAKSNRDRRIGHRQKYTRVKIAALG